MQLKIQFNDTLTSTFEYPSEKSLLLADDTSPDALSDTLAGMNASGGGLLGSMPIGNYYLYFSNIKHTFFMLFIFVIYFVLSVGHKSEKISSKNIVVFWKPKTTQYVNWFNGIIKSISYRPVMRSPRSPEATKV